MDQVLADHLPEVASICRRHRVGRLDVFGSAACRAHGAADLDFLVEFEDLPADDYADAYFGLLEELEALFERPVDLVMASAVRNPFLRETIDRTRVPLHSARSAGRRPDQTMKRFLTAFPTPFPCWPVAPPPKTYGDLLKNHATMFRKYDNPRHPIPTMTHR